MSSFRTAVLNYLTYSSVFVIAAGVRIWCFLGAVTGPLSVFSGIQGLDMKTHLELGELFSRGESIYTHYRLLAALCNSEPMVLLLMQYISGILLALLLTWAAKIMIGNSDAAILAGVIGAWYGPELLYESVTLPESVNVFFIFLGFAGVLLAAKKHFSPFFLFLGGAAVAMAAVGRPATLLYAAILAVFLIFNGGRKRFWLVLAGIMAVFLPIGIYHGIKGFNVLPFYGSNIAYIAEVGQKLSPGDLNLTAGDRFSMVDYAVAVIGKIPGAFGCVQTPNNVNYYFLREFFLPLRLSIGAAFLYVAGWSGIFFWLMRKRRRYVEILLVISVVALTLPLAAFQPLGRYKLMIYPFLTLGAADFIYRAFCGLRRRKISRVMILSLLLGTVVGFRFTGEQRRTADYLNWGIGCAETGTDDEIYFYRIAFEARPDLPRAASLYASALSKRGDHAGAERVIRRHLGALGRGNAAVEKPSEVR